MTTSGLYAAFTAVFKAFAVTWLLLTAFQYVEQQRYESITVVPCNDGMCVLVRDAFTGAYFYEIMPPIPNKDIVTGAPRRGGVSI